MVKMSFLITIKQGSTNTYCHEVDILGISSKIVYGGNDKIVIELMCL